jgi:hypothetical protein
MPEPSDGHGHQAGRELRVAARSEVVLTLAASSVAAPMICPSPDPRFYAMSCRERAPAAVPRRLRATAIPIRAGARSASSAVR